MFNSVRELEARFSGILPSMNRRDLEFNFLQYKKNFFGKNSMQIPLSLGITLPSSSHAL